MKPMAESRVRLAKGWVVLALCWLGAIALRGPIDARSGVGGGGEPLYIPSARVLRYLSLGNEGLLADIYWTRAVQYYGREKLAGGSRLDLLGPLLGITTSLDPHLIVAYRFGAILLAEKPPGGAGQPEQALALLRSGIVANPETWRLWQDLGFVYYWDLRDYRAAARAFEAGAGRPGAPTWLRTLAATVASQGGDFETSRRLWEEIFRHADNDQLAKSAEDHLAALETQEELARLDNLLAGYREGFGHEPRTWSELIQAGLLRAAPADPSGAEYRIDGGWARLGPGTKIDLRLVH